MNLNVKRSILGNFLSLKSSSSRALRTSRFCSEKNYYDLLNLKRDCNAKEIRDAFINLAKKYHPDTNPEDPRNHTRFIEIQKAYSVLSVPDKRMQYDSGLNYAPNFSSRTGPYKTYGASANDFNDEFREFYYKSRHRNANAEPQSRLGAVKVTLFFIAFTAVGAVLQYYFLRWLYRRSYDEEMEKHHRGTASIQALKNEMDKRAEEYDVAKLRAAYFKEVGSNVSINMHLVPSIIRPKLPQHLKPKDKSEIPSEEKISSPNT